MVTVRPATSRDHAYIRSTWLKSFADSPLARSLTPSVYQDRWTSIIGTLLDTCLISIAFDPDEPGVILGWLAYDQPEAGTVLHYCYVRDRFRRAGVARKLLEGIDLSSCTYTHRTLDAQRITAAMPEDQRPAYDFTKIWELS